MKAFKTLVILLSAALIISTGNRVYAQNTPDNFPSSDLLALSAGAGAPKDLPDMDVKIYNVKTKDNWTLSVDRYGIKDYPASKKAAVILCHGFNMNNKFWDLDERCSLAAYLANAGYDVWLPSLRGSGLSSKPLIDDIRNLVKLDLAGIPQNLLKMPSDLTKFGWDMDDHVNEDVPTIINLVRNESGCSKIYWIGHSMGGIIMFAYLEYGNQKDIAGFIPIGSMIVVERPLTPSLKIIANQKPLLTASLLINVSVASQFSNFTCGAIKNPIEELFLKRENMDDKVLFRFFKEAINDTSPGVVSQFSDSIRLGKMLSRDGKINYTDALGRVEVPVLMLAGLDDAFVNERALKKAFDGVSSGDKEMIVFSRENGYSTDYGHCDLILGRNSEEEVYPVILNWLDARAARGAK